jgi:hypothetical protein
MRFNEVPKDDIIVGMAIFTAVTLRPTDKVPKKRVRAIHHLRKPSGLGEGLIREFMTISEAKEGGPLRARSLSEKSS